MNASVTAIVNAPTSLSQALDSHAAVPSQSNIATLIGGIIGALLGVFCLAGVILLAVWKNRRTNRSSNDRTLGEVSQRSSQIDRSSGLPAPVEIGCVHVPNESSHYSDVPDLALAANRQYDVLLEHEVTKR